MNSRVRKTTTENTLRSKRNEGRLRKKWGRDHDVNVLWAFGFDMAEGKEGMSLVCTGRGKVREPLLEGGGGEVVNILAPPP